MQKIEIFNKNVINTGFDNKNIQYYGFPYKDLNDQTFNITNNSFLRCVLPFDKEKDLADLFVRFNNNQIRIGKLLELMDMMSSHVCY